MHQPNLVVDHISNFTAHRDKEVLAFSLLKSVISMMDCTKAEMISIDKKGDFLSSITFENSQCIVNTSKSGINHSLQNAFSYMNASSSEEHVLKTDSGYSLIRLLQHDRNSEQFVVIYLSQKASKAQSYVLSGMLSIYTNFLSLLNESQTDELTGLANRKTFDSAISKVFDSLPQPFDEVDNERRELFDGDATKSADRFWLAIVDIDHFKQVNDRFGHLYGDEILIHLAQIIRSSFRRQDLQFRFGGEEFVILLSGESKQVCENVLERFRLNVEEYDFPSVNNITVSIGVIEFKRSVFHKTSFDQADQALYFSKKNGRNKTTFYEDMVSRGEVEEAPIEEGDIDLF
jgi:diguanylate cyclase (GGDEF)-like protein